MRLAPKRIGYLLGALLLAVTSSAWAQVAVTLTAPTNGATHTAPATITVSATATPPPGYAISKVEFFQGTTLIGTDKKSPYSIEWNNVGQGDYTLTAKATATQKKKNGPDQTGTSSPVSVTVNPPPSWVALTAPANGATYTPPASITLTATAAPPRGYTVSKVEFFQGTTLIGTATTNPYSTNWTDVPSGNYTLTAKATAIRKNKPDETATSAPVNITVNAQLYFVHADHLNTPRLVANQSGQTVWRWDQQEPFGDSPPDENPSGLGVFPFPLRFDGTYADQETGMLQNWHRELDRARGQYLQSDPIGLQSGLNTYAYVLSNPLSFVDPTGLQIVVPGGAIGGSLPGAGGPLAPGGGIRPSRPGDDPLGDIQAPGKPTWPFPSSGAEADDGTGQSAGRLAPPGKCTQTQHRRLQDEVDAACKIQRRCDPSQDCPQLLDNYYKNIRCAQARDEINNTCFAGGDAGHRQAANDARNAANRCIAVMQQKGCANCPVPPNK